MVETLALLGAAGLFEARALDEVDFAADQRLDALRLGLIVEIDRTEKIAMVGERERGHPQRLRAIHQPVDAAGAIEQAVIGVKVEMDEIFVGGRHAVVSRRATRCLRKRGKVRFRLSAVILGRARYP